MYSGVSELFKTCMKNPVQTRRISGTIGGIAISAENILQGSLGISNQCCDTSDISLGNVYIAEMKCTLRGISLNRSEYQGKQVTLSEGLLLSDNTWEDIPLGVFTIDSAEWTASGVDIVAYDNMSKFDKSFSGTSTGKPYEFLTFVCSRCSVELGMTEQEVKALPNGEQLLSIYEENDIETCRDLLGWIAQACACNALIGRDGKLYLRQFQAPSSAVGAFDATERLQGGKFSDFETRYTGLSIVEISNQKTKYYGLEVDDGLTMKLGSNPLLQYGTQYAKDNQRKAILNSISAIDYTPAELDIHAPMVYDLMDVLEFSGGILGNDDVAYSCVTKYDWTYNRSYKITCVGSNPALANGRSKVDKNIAGILSQVNTNEFTIYSFTNAEDFEIGTADTKIISMRFTAKEQTTAIFHAEILAEAVPDVEGELIAGTATVTYKLNDVPIDTFIPKQILLSGRHILTLYLPLENITADEVSKLDVYLGMSSGTLNIGQAQIKATIDGTGLAAAKVEWDGTLEFTDDFGVVNCGTPAAFTVQPYDDSVNVATQSPARASLTATFGVFSVADIVPFTVKGLDVLVTFGTETQSFTINAEIPPEYNHIWVTVNASNAFEMVTSYGYASASEAIDEGTLQKLSVPTASFESIAEFEISIVGEPTLAFFVNVQNPPVYDADIVKITARNAFAMLRDYVYNAEAEDVDEGILQKVDITTTGFESISKIEVSIV